MKLFLLIVVTFFTFAWACAPSNSGSSAEVAAAPPISKELSRTNDVSNGNTAEIARKLIKNGSIDFETKSVTETQATIVAMLANYNGYLANQNEAEYDDQLSYNMNVRIPANRFDEFFNEVASIAHRIENQNVNVEDVTQEFIDVETRIKTKKELEIRYFDLLNKAKTVEEMLSIERELGTLRSDIESMEGRLQYLKNQTSYSTVHIHFYQVKNREFGFISKFLQAFANGWRNLLSFTIGLVSLWPFLIILAVLIILWRRYRPFRRK